MRELSEGFLTFVNFLKQEELRRFFARKKRRAQNDRVASC